MSNQPATLRPVDFQYFSSIIPLIIGEFIIVTLIFLYYRRCCCGCCRNRAADEMDITSYDEETGILSNPSQTLFKFQCQFEDTYESYYPPARYLLFITRVLSLAYICGVSVAANYVINGRNQWYFFTLWNLELISLYYFLAVGCSIMGFVYGNKSLSNLCVIKVTNESSTRILWSIAINRFAYMMHILYEICGGNAFMVVSISFILLNRNFTFWNVSAHFVPAISMLMELFLNNIFVRFDHFPFNLMWPMIFLLFIWPIVYTGVISGWPYFFLRTDTHYCFLFYNGLLIANLIFYFLWYGCSELKFKVRMNFQKSNGESSSK